MSIVKSISTAAACIFFIWSGSARAQTLDKKVEVGVHYTTIGLGVFDTREHGGGARLSYNINDYLAVEAEGNVLEFTIGDHPTDDFLAVQGFLGVKAGLRGRRMGVFAKVRPGVANFPMLRVNSRFCSAQLPCTDARRSGNRFALDAGAVVEFYPRRNIILRFDLGDTMLHFNEDSFFRSTELVRIRDGFSHNLQLSVGVGFRF